MSFLKTAHLHADALSNQVDAMVRLGAGELGAIIVEGVYPKAQPAKLPALLADNKPISSRPLTRLPSAPISLGST